MLTSVTFFLSLDFDDEMYFLLCLAVSVPSLYKTLKEHPWYDSFGLRLSFLYLSASDEESNVDF